MEDIKNIRISSSAERVALQLKNEYEVDDLLPILRIGLAYALKTSTDYISNHFEELDSKYPSDGPNYNVGSIDPDGIIRKLFPILFDGCTTPYRYARIAIILGLELIEGEMTDLSFNLADLM